MLDRLRKTLLASIVLSSVLVATAPPRPVHAQLPQFYCMYVNWAWICNSGEGLCNYPDDCKRFGQ